tara:strand:- start:4049 stop:4243 length:195 start_codon:yes stop_codon:yes gene_type:complete
MSAYRQIISQYWIQDGGGMVYVYKDGSKYVVEAYDDEENMFLKADNIYRLEAAENRAEEIALLV